MSRHLSPPRLWAGRLLAYLGAGDARREEPPGLVVLPVAARAAGRWSAGDGWGGGDPAAICGGNSAVFNQPLTTIRCGEMDWCGYVFYLCISAIYRPPGGDSVSRGRGWGAGGLGRSGRQGGDTRPARGGVAEKGTVLLRMGGGESIAPHPPHHSMDFGGGGKQAGGLSAIRA